MKPPVLRKQLINGSLKALEWSMRTLPRWLIKFFMTALFSMATLGTARIRGICVRNLMLVYGDTKNQKEYEHLANQHLKSIGYSMMDLLYYVDRPQELSKIMHIEHEDHLKKALAAGRGVIGVTAHLGNFPLLFVALSQRGYKVNVIIRPMRDEVFSQFMYRQCNKWNINMIQTLPKKQFLRETLGALKRNELLFILLDEVVAKEDGVQVPFFDRQVSRATGPMLFFKRSGAAILPVFIIKDPNNHYQIFVKEPFKNHDDGSEQENTVKNIGGITNIIEGFVRRFPLQWGGWLNKRWASESN